MGSLIYRSMSSCSFKKLVPLQTSITFNSAQKAAIAPMFGIIPASIRSLDAPTWTCTRPSSPWRWSPTQSATAPTATGRFSIPLAAQARFSIAAEQTNRRARVIEIDPLCNADTIVKRWQAFTGKTAINASSGAKFSETNSVGRPNHPTYRGYRRSARLKIGQTPGFRHEATGLRAHPT